MAGLDGGDRRSLVGRTCAKYGRRSTEERTIALTLSDEQQRMLGDALAHYLNEFRVEINRSDDHAFKQKLVSHLDDLRSSP